MVSLLIEGSFWLGLGWGSILFYHGEQLLSTNNYCPPLASTVAVGGQMYLVGP